VGAGGQGIVVVHAESGDEVCTVPTVGGVNVLEWSRVGLVYAGDAGGVRVVVPGL